MKNASDGSLTALGGPDRRTLFMLTAAALGSGAAGHNQSFGHIEEEPELDVLDQFAGYVEALGLTLTAGQYACDLATHAVVLPAGHATERVGLTDLVADFVVRVAGHALGLGQGVRRLAEKHERAEKGGAYQGTRYR